MQRSWLLVRSVIIGYTNSEEKRACKGIDLECSTEVMYRALLSSSLELVISSQLGWSNGVTH